MLLEGSCHCQAVRFRVRSAHPYPFNVCYCGICRKTAGAGGSAINLGADHRTLEIEGEDSLSVYRARVERDGETVTSSARRHFCKQCGSPLWLWSPDWPDLVHPHASAIDTDLPVPPERVHLMLGSRAAWVQPDVRGADSTFDGYPKESIADWHRKRGLERPDG